MTALCLAVLLFGTGIDRRPHGWPLHSSEAGRQEGQAGARAPEVITEILVHGNHVTRDEDIVRMSGLTIGAPFAADTIALVQQRLRAGHFDDVDVLKRLASIADPSKVVVVIVVNEGAVRIDVPKNPALPIRVLKRRGLANLMYFPILDAEDGYGLTYGVHVAYVNVTGKRARVSVPVSWGGTKRAGIEFERTFTGPLSRIVVGTAFQRRHNPAFDEEDGRRRVWVRFERTHRSLRVGSTIGWEGVRFADFDDRLRYAGVDVTFDTRLDPVLPRHALLASVQWTTFRFQHGERLTRARFDGRGYVGLVGQSVLVVRALREDASDAQAPYFQSLLGGWSNLRGFEAGSFTGDRLLAGSLELRVPMTSPLEVAKLGVSGFVDVGTAYGRAERLGDRPFQTGIGGGLWVAATVVQFGLSVAHGRGARTRVNFGAALTF